MLTLDDRRRREMFEVNREVNSLPYRTDLDLYKKPEFWTEIDRRGGDCEDFAIAKRNRLLALGWPLEALRLATCWTETGESHAVLTIDTDRGTWLLDNRFHNPIPWTTPSYRWVSRQSGKNWVPIAPGQAG